jgi:hypothetical protein
MIFSGRTVTEAKAALSRRLVSPKSDEGGSETQAEAQHHGKGQARDGRDGNTFQFCLSIEISRAHFS